MTEEDCHFAELRRRMVAEQLQARDIRCPDVLEVFRRVPRHCFVPAEHQQQAYEDHPLPIGYGQTISQPYMVALMTEALDLRPSDRVLEIGTGSGYQTAVLAELTREVVSIERSRLLGGHARECLLACGYRNITFIIGDGSVGYPEGAPYDAVIVTAGSPIFPVVLRDQLALGGRLICPVGDRDMQQLVKITRKEDGFDQTNGIKCRFVPLIGKEGWESSDEVFPSL